MCICIYGVSCPVTTCCHKVKQITSVLLHISSPYNMRMNSVCLFKRTFRSVAQKIRVLLLLVAKGHNVSMAEIKE